MSEKLIPMFVSICFGSALVASNGALGILIGCKETIYIFLMYVEAAHSLQHQEEILVDIYINYPHQSELT